MYVGSFRPGPGGLMDVGPTEEHLRDQENEPSREAVQSLRRSDRTHAARGPGMGTDSVLQRSMPADGFGTAADRRCKLSTHRKSWGTAWPRGPHNSRRDGALKATVGFERVLSCIAGFVEIPWPSPREVSGPRSGRDCAGQRQPAAGARTGRDSDLS